MILTRLCIVDFCFFSVALQVIESLTAMLNDTGLFFPDTADLVSVATWADNLHDRFDSQLFSSWHFANLVRSFVEKHTQTIARLQVEKAKCLMRF